MRALLSLFAWRAARRRPLRAALSALAVALAAALFVAVDAVHATLASSLQARSRALSGRAELAVVERGTLGVGLDVLARVRAVEGVLATPVIEGTAWLPDSGEGPLLVLGLDLGVDSLVRDWAGEAQAQDLLAVAATFLRPDALLVTRSLAERLGLASGAELVLETRGVRHELEIGGLLSDVGPARALGGNLAVLRIEAAARLFRAPGRCDRIEVAPAEGVDSAELTARLASALGPDYELRPLDRRSAVERDALARVEALSTISVVVLVVGLLLIYNSASIGVVERAREIGALRCLGARRREILAVVLCEWSAVGLVGSVVGSALGVLIAGIAVRLASRTVNLFGPMADLSEAALHWRGPLGAVVAGTLTAALAALVPALAAARSTPVTLLRAEGFQLDRAPRVRRALLLGILLALLSGAALLAPVRHVPLWVLLASSSGLLLAVALCAPAAALALARLLRPLARRGRRFELALAVQNAARFPDRTAVATVAFAGAVGVMVGTAAIVRSFERASERWMDEFLPFDLTLTATELETALYAPTRYGVEVLDAARAVPGVEAGYGVATRVVPFRESEILLIAYDMEDWFVMQRARGSPASMRALDLPERRARLEGGEALLVSENLARLAGLVEGEQVELPTPRGPARFTIEAVVEDYSWPAGAAMLDRAAYARLWSDDSIHFTDLRIAPGSSAGEVRAALAPLCAAHGLLAYSVEDLKGVARELLAQAMVLADVQVFVALGIGFLGLVNTLVLSVLRRAREIALVRAAGATRSQVARTAALESLLLATAGGVLGIALGLLAAAVPMRLVTLELSGYWVPLATPWGSIALALAAALVLGAVASFLPARRAARTRLVEALAYE